MAAWFDRWFLAGYAGVTGFHVLEMALRSPEGSAHGATSDEDRGTTEAIVVSSTMAALGAPLLRQLPLPRLPGTARAIGLCTQAVGLGLRVWSMQTLKASYSRSLRVTNSQAVIEDGPYRHIRHPGYLGSLLVWLGFAASSDSLAVVAFVIGLMLPAYRRRIQAEEELLRKELDGYEDYCGRTARLIPGVW